MFVEMNMIYSLFQSLQYHLIPTRKAQFVLKSDMLVNAIPTVILNQTFVERYSDKIPNSKILLYFLLKFLTKL
jgi:hypothetical protein